MSVIGKRASNVSGHNFCQSTSYNPSDSKSCRSSSARIEQVEPVGARCLPIPGNQEIHRGNAANQSPRLFRRLH